MFVMNFVVVLFSCKLPVYLLIAPSCLSLFCYVYPWSLFNFTCEDFSLFTTKKDFSLFKTKQLLCFPASVKYRRPSYCDNLIVY